jgi:hypothetical protein
MLATVEASNGFRGRLHRADAPDVVAVVALAVLLVGLVAVLLWGNETAARAYASFAAVVGVVTGHTLGRSGHRAAEGHARAAEKHAAMLSNVALQAHSALEKDHLEVAKGLLIALGGGGETDDAAQDPDDAGPQQDAGP